jgi:hypothetical protein
MPDPHQQLAYDSRLPLQLRRIRKMLPLESTRVAKAGILWSHPARRRSQNLHQLCPGVVATLPRKLSAHQLTGQAAGHKDSTALVTPDRVASIGEIMELDLDHWTLLFYAKLKC